MTNVTPTRALIAAVDRILNALQEGEACYLCDAAEGEPHDPDHACGALRDAQTDMIAQPSTYGRVSKYAADPAFAAEVQRAIDRQRNQR